jgi:hypothetical protein
VALLSRWVRPPAEFRKLLAGQDRVLAIAETGTDPGLGVVVATQHGLWLPNESGWRRIGWNDIVKASWTDGGLNVVEGKLDSDGIVNDRDPVRVMLTEPRTVPAVVRTRVEASIARSEQVNVPGGTGRIVARRVPGVDGVTWTARLDSGTADTQPARAALIGYLARVTSQLD